MSDSFKSRVRKLEQRNSAGDAGLLATILRRSNGEGGVAAAITSLETELGRRLDPALAQRAEQTAVRIQALMCEIERVTNGTAWEEEHHDCD